MTNYIIDFIKYYTIDLIYSDGSFNPLGILSIIFIIGYIIFRLRKSGPSGGYSYKQ